ncbi:hypothetical protein OEZ86_014468 [Tetradesmus obliquus]|nr:hypothetical protein OEZ86_014468 [Tetradesmus obliquus]
MQRFCNSPEVRRCPLSSAGGRPCSGCNRSCPASKAGAAGCKKAALAPSPASKPLPRQQLAPPPEALGIYYSTATGKTEEVANIIKEVLGNAAAEPQDIGDVPDLAAALTDPSLDGLLVGAPTWNTGADEGRSGTAWDDVLAQVKGLSLQGRKVAVFGCGDQHGYGDYFCDAMEELHSSFAAAGADMVGAWPTEGYEHSESKAETKPGFFCGLALDEDSQGELTEGRIRQWTAQVLQEMGVKAPTAAA